jgi:EAL domain-containing protein (putative c-di-GMP-specific phosphodiesterase class I)
MPHDCHCQTGKRTLNLTAPTLASDYPELLAFAVTARWGIDLTSCCVAVPISGCGQFTGIVDVVNFLRGILSPGQLGGLRAAWSLEGGREELTSVTTRRAEPILSMVDGDSSPLMAMLRERRIETWFQPIFAARSLELWGYECLMRGRDLDGKLVSPAVMIDWAKQEQLVFMLDRVCRETHLLTAGQLNLPAHAKLLINFMPTSIYQPEYCLQTTMAAARKGNLEPSRIIFEVVESEEVADHAHLSRILDYYRAHGYGVALDDLGSGYAGLSLLADLNPDLIKIDRGLISKSTTSRIHRSICESLVRIGKDNGKLVLAEGVERPEEMELMRRAGVDLFQGFLFGKPNPTPATAALVNVPQAMAA